MRVYLPTTFGALVAAMSTGEFGPAPLTAFAVTPALREWYASGDAEELEYAAMTDAARECLRLLARAPEGPARRAVIAADVPDPALTPTPDVHPAAIRVSAPIRLADVVSVHVDPPEVAPEIRAAAEAIAAADAGADDAAFTVDGVEDHELHWYATQELADVLRDVS